jgi:hypothetical protein
LIIDDEDVITGQTNLKAIEYLLFFALLELVSYIKEVLTETKDIMKNYFW